MKEKRCIFFDKSQEDEKYYTSAQYTHFQNVETCLQTENCRREQLPIHYESLYRTGIHGIEHAYRVLLLVREIAAHEKLSIKITHQLEFCAIFHDIGRINDGIDDLHGKRAIQLLIKNNFWGLEKYDNQLVRFIIENHCIDDSLSAMTAKNYNLLYPDESIYLLTIFKDADNLDRFRIDDFDSKYLRNKFSHTLINRASQLFYTGENQIAINKELLNTYNNLQESCYGNTK